MTIESAAPVFVRTVAERCRVCYTCVRECPAKAIRIHDGQAEIVPERCICCGNCVKVCSQKAKQIVRTTDEVEAVLASGRAVAACLAPSFPAEFDDIPYRKLVGMLRAAGFSLVAEVAVGADLVAKAYAELLGKTDGERFIATSCPGIVEYVERYHPDLVPNLAPIVSPMIATSRALKKLHGEELAIVFLGPCIAKKLEAASGPLAGEVDAVLTFVSLREFFDGKGIRPEDVEESDFDPPRPGLGALFPISRGLLQAAAVSEDLLEGNVVAADGRAQFVQAINEFEAGALETKLLEVLCCSGCIMGPGMTTDALLFERRARVSAYARERLDGSASSAEMHPELHGLDLSRTYEANDQRVIFSDDAEIERILARMGKFSPEDELNCGACGYDTCRDHAIAIRKGLAESEMCLPYTIDRLKKAFSELEVSHEKLASAQAALLQAEKLAHMGQLAAGIAHEINNPLGVILLYAHMLLEDAPKGEAREDLEVVVEQADRCKTIVSGLLQFARKNKVLLRRKDIYELSRRALDSVQLPKETRVRLDRASEDTCADVDPDQVSQIVTNLVSNAADAMGETGGEVVVTVGGDERHVTLAVRDTGCGIPEERRDKIFEPFFTTKQIGKGTGLGLAVTYGIVKMHRGEISVRSNADTSAGPTYTEFSVCLPKLGRRE